MSFQIFATYLQGFLLIPIFGVDAIPQQTGEIPQLGAAQRREIQNLYDTAVQFRRTGLLEMAHDSFQEVVNRAPNSELGRAALEQANALEPRIFRPGTQWTIGVAERETGVVTANYAARSPQSVEGDLVNLHELRTLYHQAKRLRQQQKWHDAHRVFQQVHMIAPTSSYGQDAVDQMHDIEKQIDGPAPGEQAPSVDAGEPSSKTKRPGLLGDRIRHLLETTEPIEVHLEKPVKERNWIVPAKFERKRDEVPATTTRDYKVNAYAPSVFGGIAFDFDVCQENGTRAEGRVRVGMYGCRIEYDAQSKQRWHIEWYTANPSR